MSTDLKKESLRVFWDYLKFSERYRSICKHAKTFKQPDKYWIPYSEGNLNLSFVYEDFGDIFSTSFNEWWKRNSKNLNLINKKAMEPKISDYGDIVSEQISILRAFLKQHYEREPTLDEFFAEFINRIKHHPMSLFLKIDHNYFPRSKLQKYINEYLKDNYEKNFNLNGRASCDKRYKISAIELPTTIKKINMLKKYLLVFTLLKDGLKYAEVIEQVSTMFPKVNNTGRVIKDSIEDKDTYKEYHRYKIFAEQIIENIDNDIFPGKYDGIKKKTLSTHLAKKI